MTSEGTGTKLGDVARQYGVLDRIAFKVKEGETVLHLDYMIDKQYRTGLFMLLGFPWIPIIEFLIFALIPPYAASNAVFLSISLVLLCVALAITVGVILNRRRLTKFTAVNVTVFTDKAIYVTDTNVRKQISESTVTRIPWEDIKAYTIARSAVTRAIQITIHAAYDINTRSDRLVMASDPAVMKRVFESLLHQYHPLGAQRAEYYAKKGSSPGSTSFPVSASLQRRLKLRRIRMAIITPIADIIAFVIAQWIIDATPQGAARDIIYWVIEGFFYVIIVIIILGEISDFLRTFWFRAPPESMIQVREKSLEQRRLNGEVAVSFSHDLLVTLNKYISDPDYLGASRISKPKAVTRFGLVDDAFGCYYTAMERLHAWLEGDGYFMGLEEIQRVAISSHPYMGAIVRKLTGGIGEEQVANEGTIAAISRVQATIERVEDIYRLIVPMTLEGARSSLFVPITGYLDVIAPGEKILFIHHPASKQAHPTEALTTTEGLILEGSDHFVKAKYQDMAAVKVDEVARDRTSFKEVVIELRPGSTTPCIVLGRVPIDSPLFAIIFKETGIVVGYHNETKAITASERPSNPFSRFQL